MQKNNHGTDTEMKTISRHNKSFINNLSFSFSCAFFFFWPVIKHLVTVKCVNGISPITNLRRLDFQPFEGVRFSGPPPKRLEIEPIICVAC